MLYFPFPEGSNKLACTNWHVLMGLKWSLNELYLEAVFVTVSITTAVFKIARAMMP